MLNIKKIISFLFISLFISVIYAQNDDDIERYKIRNLEINDNFANFGTTFFGDKIVYSAPSKGFSIIRDVWEKNGQPYLDFYIADVEANGEMKDPKSFTALNSKEHDASAAFTKDGSTVYFSRAFKKENKSGYFTVKIFRAKLGTGSGLQDLEQLPFGGEKYSAANPTLSDDEKYLYFVSDIPGGFGRRDIYKSEIFADGSVGDPVNLGEKINTKGTERFPSITGDEFYFSSDSHDDGLGGLDIYVSKMDGNQFGEVQNLGTPINSKKDDFSFIINNETRTGYFSSNRRGSDAKGDDDIYFFQELESMFECFQSIDGIIREDDTVSLGTGIPGALVVLYTVDESKTEEENVVESTVSDDIGRYSFSELNCETQYKIVVSKETYDNVTTELTTTDENDISLPLEIKLETSPFERGADNRLIIKIRPIYFALNSSRILQGSTGELEKVIGVMNQYPNLRIELGSHTDSRGSFKGNEKLSVNRAMSTRNYIINRGISPARIIARGYGERQIINHCVNGVTCTDAEHEMNRRTEFVILNPEILEGFNN